MLQIEAILPRGPLSVIFFLPPPKINPTVGVEPCVCATMRAKQALIVMYSLGQNYLERMIFVDFSVNSEPIFLKFCTGHFLVMS